MSGDATQMDPVCPDCGEQVSPEVLFCFSCAKHVELPAAPQPGSGDEPVSALINELQGLFQKVGRDR